MAVGSIAMTPEEMDELEGRVLKILRHEDTIEPKKHALHHRWAQSEIDAQIAAKERREAVTRAVIQWSVLGILGGIAASIAAWWKGNHGG